MRGGGTQLDNGNNVRVRAPGVEEAVLGNDARAANAEQRTQDLGRLVGALSDAGPQPAVSVARAHCSQRWRSLPHHLTGICTFTRPPTFTEMCFTLQRSARESQLLYMRRSIMELSIKCIVLIAGVTGAGATGADTTGGVEPRIGANILR